MNIRRRIISFLLATFVVFGSAGSAFAEEITGDNSGSAAVTTTPSTTSETISDDATAALSTDTPTNNATGTDNTANGDATTPSATPEVADTPTIDAPTTVTPAPAQAPAASANNPTAPESEAPQAHQRADATEDSTLKVDFSIINLEPDNTVNDNSEFWVEKSVNATVNLKVSGSGADAIIHNPWLKITVPKKIIKDLKFADSQNAYQSIKIINDSIDKDNAYIIYKFTQFTGASSAAYPIPFVFDGAKASNGNTITVTADILDANDETLVSNRNDTDLRRVLETANKLPVLYHAEKTYKALKQEATYNFANIRGHISAGWRNGGTVTNIAYDSTQPAGENNEIFVYRKLDDAENSTTGDEGTLAKFFYHTVVIPPELEPNQSWYFNKPSKLFTRFHLPSNVEPTDATLLSTGVKKDNNDRVWTWDEDTRLLTVEEVRSETRVDYYQGHWFRWNRMANGYEIWLTLKDVPYWDSKADTEEQKISKMVNIPIDTTVTMPDESEFQLPAVTAHMLVDKETFSRTGNFSTSKSYQPGDTSVADIFHGNNPEGAQPLSTILGVYTIRDGVISDRLGQEQSKIGMYYLSTLSNYNSGSSTTNPYGGVTSQLTAYEDYLDVPAKINSGEVGNTYYSKFMINDLTFNAGLAPKMPQEGRQARVAETLEKLNSTDNVLYGIKEDGTKVELAKNVKYRQVVSIEDTSRQYKAIRLEFAEPLLMDNVNLSIVTGVKLTESELEKYKDTSYTPHEYRTGYKHTLRDANGNDKEFDHPMDGNAKVTIQSVSPKVGIRIPADKTLPYSSSGTSVTYETGVYGYWRDGFWGTLNEYNGHMLVLLPPAFEYGNKSQKLHDRVMDEEYGNSVEPEVVSNYKGTGRTALIYPTFKFAPKTWQYDDLFVNITINATKYAKKGNNQVDVYYIYENNDEISNKNDGTLSYVDELDLDNDGDVTEKFAHRYSQINYIPPLEMVVTHQVGMDQNTMSLATTGDLGYDYKYGITILNNTIFEVPNAYVIGVLPQKGDKVLAPNQDGEYTDRGSTYGVTLSKFFEDDEQNAEQLARFDVYYQTESHQGDIDGLRDGTWLTKDQIDDPSLVKAFKLVLKDGMKIKPKEEINITYTTKVPFDKTLKDADSENPDVAVSTLAFSTDGTIYSEGNKVETKYTSYTVDGVVYTDRNLDGDWNVVDSTAHAEATTESEEAVAGVTVDLVDADTMQPVSDPAGKAITATTDQDGKYHFDVYKRGNYRVRFTKNDKQRFAFVNGAADASASNNLDGSLVDENNGNIGFGQVLALNPAHRSDVSNTALESRIDITAQKTWVGITQDSATVQLYANGEKLQVSDGAVTSPDLFNAGTVMDEDFVNPATLNADNTWKHVFSELPKYDRDGQVVDYTVKEIGPDGATLDDNARFTVNETNYTVTYSSDGDTRTVTNTMDNPKISVSGVKTWDDADNQDGKRPTSITIKLLADGVETKQTKTVSANDQGEWKYTFDNLDTFDSTGKRITYSVSEVPIDGYTPTYDGMNVSNAYTPEKVNVEGTKTWNDANNQDGIRPDAVTVHLWADGKNTGKTANVTADGAWKYSFTDLDKFAAGEEIAYTVTEDAVDGYTTAIDGFNITNTHEVAKRKVEVTKVWNDADNQDGVRPDKVTVHLLADGTDTGKSIEIEPAADGSWKGSFTGLDKFKAGKEIAYTITEDAVDGYTAANSGDANTGYTVTNTHKIETIAVPVTKVWVDDNNAKGLRPNNVTIQLKADGENLEGKTLTLDAQGDWKGTLTELPKYKAGKVRQLVDYTLAETAVDNYSVAIAGLADADGFTVTNTITGKVSVAVTKKWEGIVSDAAPAVTAELLADGQVKDEVVLDGNADGSAWSHIFADLDQYTETGKEITYTIKEKDAVDGKLSAEGHEYEVAVAQTEGTDTWTITNTMVNPEVKLHVTKVWDDADNQDGIRPESVTVRLSATAGDEELTPAKLDGTPVDPLELESEDDWNGEFDALPTYDAKGREITYTVAEDEVEGYETEITGDAAHGFTVTNSHTPETIDIPVTKQWEDQQNKSGLRPESVTMRLTSDSEEVPEQVLEITADEDDTWTGTFENLPKYAPSEVGREVVYTLSEDPVIAYQTGEITGDVSEGFTVTNTLITGTLTLTKVDDHGKALQGAIFTLRDADGKTVATVTSDTDGKVVFERVVYGSYTVVETQAPEGFEKADWKHEATIDTLDQVLDLGKVTNKAIPKPVVRLAKTGAATAIWAGLATVLLLAGLAVEAARHTRGQHMGVRR